MSSAVNKVLRVITYSGVTQWISGYQLFALSVSLVLYATLSLARTRRRQSLLSRIPGPAGWPIVGNVNMIFSSFVPLQISILSAFSTLAKKHQKAGIFKFDIATEVHVYLCSHLTAETLLTSSTEVNKSSDYRFLKQFLGGGLVTSSGSKWQRDRKLLAPAFHFKILDDFNATLNVHASLLVDILRTQVNVYDFKKTIFRITLDAIMGTSMGIENNSQINHRDDGYGKNAECVTRLVIKRTINPLLQSEHLFGLTADSKRYWNAITQLHQFSDKIVETEKSRQMQAKLDHSDQVNPRSKVKSLVEILLELHLKDPIAFTQKNVREQIDTFVLAGHHTTGTALTFAIYYLAIHPNVQARLQAELDTAFEDRTRPVTTSDLNMLKYTETVIKETIRLAPPAQLISRRLVNDLTIGGYEVPRDTTVLVLVKDIHRRADLYVDPDHYKPERWLPGNEAMRSSHPFSFIPFSGGARNCIGQRYAMNEMKIILCHIMRLFKVSLIEPIDERLFSLEVSLKSLEPMNVHFALR